MRQSSARAITRHKTQMNALLRGEPDKKNVSSLIAGLSGRNEIAADSIELDKTV